MPALEPIIEDLPVGLQTERIVTLVNKQNLQPPECVWTTLQAIRFPNAGGPMLELIQHLAQGTYGPYSVAARAHVARLSGDHSKVAMRIRSASPDTHLELWWDVIAFHSLLDQGKTGPAGLLLHQMSRRASTVGIEFATVRCWHIQLKRMQGKAGEALASMRAIDFEDHCGVERRKLVAEFMAAAVADGKPTHARLRFRDFETAMLTESNITLDVGFISALQTAALTEAMNRDFHTDHLRVALRQRSHLRMIPESFWLECRALLVLAGDRDEHLVDNAKAAGRPRQEIICRLATLLRVPSNISGLWPDIKNCMMSARGDVAMEHLTLRVARRLAERTGLSDVVASADRRLKGLPSLPASELWPALPIWESF